MGSFLTEFEIRLKDNFSSQLTKGGMLLRSFKGNLDSFATKGKIFDDVAMKLTIMSQSVQMVSDSLGKLVDEPKKLAMGMEDSMAKVKSILNESNTIDKDKVKSLNEIKKASIDWAKTHVGSSESFVDTSYNMISAGLNTEQAILGTRQAMILAKATLGDTGEAAALLAGLYNNMGKKIFDSNGNIVNAEQEMERLSDVLSKTQGYFQLKNLNQLNEGLKYGIPSANAFGISLEQLNAVIGQLNTTQITGSMAGTGFKSMVSQMSKASAEIGFDIVINEKGDMNLIGTIGELKTKYEELSKTLGKQGASDKLTKAFGQEGSGSVLNLINTFDQLKGAYSEINNASLKSGTSLQMYNDVTNTTSHKLQVLQQRKDELKRKMGELMQKSNQMGLGFSSAMLEMNEAFVNSPIGEKLTIIGLNAANMGKGFFNATAQGMQFAASGLTIISLMGKMGTVKNLLINGFSLLTTGLGIAAKAVMSFGAALFTNPITWIVIGIAALAVGIFLVAKNWGTVSKFLISTWGTVKTFFSGLWDGIERIFQSAWDFIWGGLLNNSFVQIALAVFMPIIGIPIMIIKHWGVITTFFNAIPSFFIGIWNGMVNGAKNVWNGITTFFIGLWSGVKGVFQKAWGFIWNGLLNNGFIQAALIYFLPIIGIPVTIIKHWDKIISFFKAIPSFFKGIFDKVVGGIDKSFSKMTKFFKDLPEFFKGIGKSIINFLIDPINSGIDLINGIKIDVPKWVPIIGGKKFGFGIPKIPSFNTGVRNFSGGLAYVHKDELVELPGGANVYTKNETKSIFNNNRSNSTNGKVTNNYNINLNIKSLVNEIKDMENANQLLKIILNLAEASV
ncbi:MAG TPA: phage tail tape measure protein [Spirochaetota bacterium]|nr:phage tail tape measure protein [Spirochaetota bacterium]